MGSINEKAKGSDWVGLIHKSAIGWDRAPPKDKQKQLGRHNCACIADPYELRANGEPGLNLARHLSPAKTAAVRLKFAKAWQAFTTDDVQEASQKFISSLGLP